MNSEQLQELNRLKKENEQLKDQLDELNELFSIRNHLFENSDVLAWMVNKDMELTFLSPAFIDEFEKIIGKRLSVGQKILDELDESYVPVWKERFSRALAGEEITIDELISNKNENKYFRFHISPIKIHDKVIGVQVLANETTRLIQAKTKETDSVKKVQQIFNQIQDLYYEVNLDGTLAELSPAVNRFTAYSREELIGRDVGELYQNKEDRENLINKILQEGKVQGYLVNILDKDKKVKKASINATLIFDDNGKPSKIAGIISDVTEMEAINKNLRWLRRAIEQSPVTILITDIEGKIEYTNPFFTKVTGYTKEEVIGKNPSILKSNHQSTDFYKHLWNTILSGESWEGEFHNKRKNGELFWERAVISPVKNQQGNIINFIAVKEDNTKQKMDADEIQKLKAFNDRIINTMREGILVEDKNGTILYTNPAFNKMTGYSSDELIGKNWKKIVDPKYHHTVKDASHRREINLSDSYEMEILKKDDKSVPVLVGGSPILEDDKYKGLIAVFTDIRKIKEHEKKLKKALKQARLSDKLKSSFLANMSHEIRTPMNAILGFADILRNEKDLEDEIREEYFSIVEDKGNDLLQIISDIIDISKIESKIVQINNAEIELNKFLEDIFSVFEKEIAHSKKSIVLKLTLPDTPETVKVYTDKHRLNQVITNLLNNAKKFTENGEIELGYRITKTTYEFFIHDTGMGISEKNQKIIFERFRQAEDNYTRGFGGTGLGLHICKKLIKMLGGKIWVKSTLNIGSTFYFTLPINKKRELTN